MIQVIITNDGKTFCLAGTRLLSLVLPLMAGFYNVGRSADSFIRKSGRNISRGQSCPRSVWRGQLPMGLGGLLIILLPRHPVFGLGTAIAGCVVFSCKLRREHRVRAG
jgi:hypothetical protein